MAVSERFFCVYTVGEQGAGIDCRHLEWQYECIYSGPGQGGLTMLRLSSSPRYRSLGAQG